MIAPKELYQELRELHELANQQRLLAGLIRPYLSPHAEMAFDKTQELCKKQIRQMDTLLKKVRREAITEGDSYK